MIRYLSTTSNEQTPEGQREIDMAKERKNLSLIKRNATTEFKTKFPGVKQPSAGKPEPKSLQCSYCKVLYSSIFTVKNKWVVCNVLSCSKTGCTVCSCGQNEKCMNGYAQHTTRAMDSHLLPPVVLDANNDDEAPENDDA